MIDDVYDSFVPINDDIKQIVTDWQMRQVDGELAVNDHSDGRHDQRGDRPAAPHRRKVSVALGPSRTP